MIEADALSRRRRPANKTQSDAAAEPSPLGIPSAGGQDVHGGVVAQNRRRKRKAPLRRSRSNNNKKDDPPFYVLFLQTGAVLSLVSVCIWSIYRYLVPAAPSQATSSFDDDSVRAWNAAPLPPLNGEEDTNDKNNQASGDVPPRHALDQDQEKDQAETQYIPPPLPRFNLSHNANFDAFSLAQERFDDKTKQSDTKAFWKAAADLRRDFSEYYGGEHVARALIDLGLSTFGWDPTLPKNNNTTNPEQQQLPSDLKHTACRIQSARAAQRPFRFTFGGYSVTVGRGNYFHQSFPFVLERKLHDLFSLLGTNLEVKNAAIGGCPSFPYGWCMENFWGTDTDVVSWDFAMNEAGGDPLGMEAYIRHVLQLPRRPKLIVKDTFMASQRRDLLRYYVQTGALKDPVVLHTDRATEPFLSRPDRDLPLGFREWRKFGAPHGAPGQALHHPALKEHELIGWILAMHFLAAIELVALSLENDSIDLNCNEAEHDMGISIMPEPFAKFDNTTALPAWTSLLFGVDDGTNRWRMRPTKCRTSFEPIVEGGDLSLVAASGAVAQEMDVMLPKSKMYYNRGWVLDLSEKEKAAKRTLSVYGGLGFLDSKKAFYGIVMSGKLKLFLPYESMPTGRTDAPAKYPRLGDNAIDWFRSVVICKVNEKRDDDTCNIANDLSFEIGGVDMTNETKAIDSSGTLYLGRKICVYTPVPPRAVLTTAATIKSNDTESVRRNIVFPDDAKKKIDDRIGLEVSVRVRNHLIVQISQACSVSHAIWEQQLVA
ncbi:hypothetical protein ACA910_020223 [Epithemia clementina (nom. ined.)]